MTIHSRSCGSQPLLCEDQEEELSRYMHSTEGFESAKERNRRTVKLLTESLGLFVILRRRLDPVESLQLRGVLCDRINETG
jgi:hypothetical protein